MEYFKYMRDLLNEAGAGYVKIWGGGGGVIVYEEKKELERYGISQIFHPEDGRRMGLEGMIQMIIKESDFKRSRHERCEPDGEPETFATSRASASPNRCGTLESRTEC